MGHLAPGFRKNIYGRVEHRMFDIADLLYGEAAKNGWVDSPDKIPDHEAMQKADDARKAATAKTTAREPKVTGEVYGKRGNPGPRDSKGRYVKS